MKLVVRVPVVDVEDVAGVASGRSRRARRPPPGAPLPRGTRRASGTAAARAPRGERCGAARRRPAAVCFLSWISPPCRSDAGVFPLFVAFLAQGVSPLVAEHLVGRVGPRGRCVDRRRAVRVVAGDARGEVGGRRRGVRREVAVDRVGDRLAVGGRSPSGRTAPPPPQGRRPSRGRWRMLAVWHRRATAGRRQRLSNVSWTSHSGEAQPDERRVQVRGVHVLILAEFDGVEHAVEVRPRRDADVVAVGALGVPREERGCRRRSACWAAVPFEPCPLTLKPQVPSS